MMDRSRTVRIGGLAGEAGKKEIEHNLRQVDGVKKVDVSLAGKEVSITYDPDKAGERQLLEILNNLGYAPLE